MGDARCDWEAKNQAVSTKWTGVSSAQISTSSPGSPVLIGLVHEQVQVWDGQFCGQHAAFGQVVM